MNRKRLIIFFELMISYLALDSINYMFVRHDPAFMTFPLHPYWVVILLFACAYGFAPGFLAGLLASGHVLFVLFKGMPTKVALEKMLESQGLLLPVSFIFVGIILGEIRQKAIVEECELREDMEKLTKTLKTTKESLHAVERMRSQLETRIVGETTTVKTLYDTAKKFEMLSAEKAYSGCLEMLGTHLKVERASLYVVEGNYFILKAAHGGQRTKWWKEKF